MVIEYNWPILPHEAQDREVPKAKAFRAASKALRFQGPSFVDFTLRWRARLKPIMSSLVAPLTPSQQSLDVFRLFRRLDLVSTCVN